MMGRNNPVSTFLVFIANALHSFIRSDQNWLRYVHTGQALRLRQPDQPLIHVQSSPLFSLLASNTACAEFAVDAKAAILSQQDEEELRALQRFHQQSKEDVKTAPVEPMQVEEEEDEDEDDEEEQEDAKLNQTPMLPAAVERSAWQHQGQGEIQYLLLRAPLLPNPLLLKLTVHHRTDRQHLNIFKRRARHARAYNTHIY